MPWMKPAARRNLIRTAIVTAIYVGGLFAARYLIADVGVARPLALGVALVPGLAIVGFFYSTGKMIIETDDEFMRMLVVRQQLIAAGFAMSVASVWGVLEMFDLVPHVEAFYVMILWVVGALVGQLANRITHGVWGACP
jgi:hypothetical protein